MYLNWVPTVAPGRSILAVCPAPAVDAPFIRIALGSIYHAICPKLHFVSLSTEKTQISFV
jgi:hypothetical protein